MITSRPFVIISAERANQSPLVNADASASLREQLVRAYRSLGALQGAR
jgi:hypothetical protein